MSSLKEDVPGAVDSVQLFKDTTDGNKALLWVGKACDAN